MCFLFDFSLVDFGSKRRRRIKANEGNGYGDSAFSASWRLESERKRNYTYSQVVDHSDPFSTNDLLKELDSGKFGSVTKEIEELLKRRRQLLDSFYAMNPELPSVCLDVQNKVVSKSTELATLDVIDLDDDQDGNNAAVKRFVPEAQLSHHAGPVVIIDSDDDNDARSKNYRSPYLEVDLKKPFGDLLMKDKPSGNLLMKDFVVMNF